ncbi:MAG: hypothetical protein NVSMB3_10390 [Acidobacteriaceae bacterium]
MNSKLSARRLSSCLPSLFLTSAALLLPLLHQTTDAQSPKQVTQIVQSLSPASQRTIERLSTFDQLPATQWRYHAGDLAHGEAVDLDDSS